MKKLILFGIICVLAASGFAYYQFNKPHKDVSKLKSEYVISANEIYSAFEENESYANEKYLDKIVEIRGIISQIEMENGKSSILLNGSLDGFGMVNCALNQKIDLEKYSSGDAIIIKGVCTGFLMDVVLNKCVIIN